MLPKTNEYIKRAYENACKHGFHDKKLSVEHCLMLVITEIAEAVEADRKDMHADVLGFEERTRVYPDFIERFEAYIKDSFEDELADIYIRLCDTAGMLGIEYEQRIIDADMNVRFSYDLKGEKRLTEKMYFLIDILTDDKDYMPLEKIGTGLFFIEWLAKDYDIDLAWHVEQKMKYNETRANLHGKKY